MNIFNLRGGGGGGGVLLNPPMNPKLCAQTCEELMMFLVWLVALFCFWVALVVCCSCVVCVSVCVCVCVLSAASALYCSLVCRVAEVPDFT